jgi:hypothetical protein
VQALRDLRNIQIAHSLIPWTDPTVQVWAHDLADFAEALFNFVVDLEARLKKRPVSLSPICAKTLKRSKLTQANSGKP